MSDLVRRLRALGPVGARWAAVALLAAGSAVVGTIWGPATALLGLAGLAMLLGIAAFWASLRMLAGESPLDPVDAYALGAEAGDDEQKRALLRALEDLEQDHGLGRVDDADYTLLRARYRAEAQTLLGAELADSGALRARVEQRIAERRASLGGDDGLDRPSDAPEAPPPSELDDGEGAAGNAGESLADTSAARAEGAERAPAKREADRRRKRRPSCARCGSPNDRDARFCKRCGKPLGALLVIALLLVGPTAAAQPSAPPLPDAAMGGELPPGHPDISQLRGGAGMAGPHGMSRPRRPSNVLEDPLLPEGTMEIVVLDADDRPVPRAALELSLLRRTMSGEAQSDAIEASADEAGHVRFDDLPVGEATSYWLRVTRDRGQFFVDPFGLPEERGVRVRVRALETTSDPAETDLEVWAMVALEVRESVLLVEHVLRISNSGPKAWVPDAVTLSLPPGATELEADETMMGGMVRAATDAVALEGTFAIGVTDLRYRYQLALTDEAEQILAVGLPPASSWIRVVTPAVEGLGLEVAGLGTAKPGRSPDGKQLLVAEQRSDQPNATGPRRLVVTLTGLPAAGSARWVALGLSVLALLWGLSVGWRRRRDAGPSVETLQEAREVLLDEVAALERAAGEEAIDRAGVETTRRGLVEALVRIEQRIEHPS